MVLFIEVSGTVTSRRDSVFNFGRTVPDMKVTGVITKLLVVESFSTPMAMFLKANGGTIRRTDKAFTITIMELCLQATGKMINKTA